MTDEVVQIFAEAGVITRESTNKDANAAGSAATSSDCSNRLPVPAGLGVIATLAASLAVHISLIVIYWNKHRKAKKTRELPSTSRMSMRSMTSDGTTRYDEEDQKYGSR